MFGLIGKITAVPGGRDELIAALLDGTKDMPGCLSYVVSKDTLSEDTVWITEVWDSKRSHEASLKLPAVRQAIAKGRPMIARMDVVAETEPSLGRRLGSSLSDEHPVLDQVNIVTGAFAESLAFYRELGMTIPDSEVAATGGAPFHANGTAVSGAQLDLDSTGFAQIWNEGWQGHDDLNGRVFLVFRFASREAVDARYKRLTSAGYRGMHPPHDAFWGSRFAVVEDPEGIGVGLMSPRDPSLSGPPPEF